MAEAKFIARLVHLVKHDHTELVNMDDISRKSTDKKEQFIGTKVQIVKHACKLSLCMHIICKLSFKHS